MKILKILRDILERLPVASTEAVPKPITKFEDTLRAAKGTQELDLFLETLVKEGVLKRKTQ